MSGPVPAPVDANSGGNVGYFVTSILSEHESLRAENADLRAQLAVARQHADPVAAATITDLQQRYDREREHHTATRNALNAMRAAWGEFERYSSSMDAHLHDARNELRRVMDESVGYTRFPPPPNPMALAGPATMRMIGPARTLPVFPGMPATLPPAPTAIPAHRHRPDGNDERPAKRQRADGPRHAADVRPLSQSGCRMHCSDYSLLVADLASITVSYRTWRRSCLPRRPGTFLLLCIWPPSSAFCLAKAEWYRRIARSPTLASEHACS